MTRALSTMALLWIAAILLVPSTLALDAPAPLPRLEAVSADGSSVQVQARANASADVVANSSFGLLDAPSPPPDVSPSSAGNSVAAGRGAATITAVSAFAVGVGLLVLIFGWLNAGVGLGFFSRIDSHHILDNDARRRVHEAILANPGITIKEVAAIAALGWGTTVHHLARLEAEKLVCSARHRQFRRYFRNGGGIANGSKNGYSELKNPTAQRLAAEVAQRPGVVQQELCEAIGISPPLAHKHLARLEAAELLTREREWRNVKYFPTQRLHDLLVSSATVSPVAA